MIINKIKKMSNGKYKIFFQNDSMIFYEDVIIKYGLLYKKNIEESIMNEVLKDNYYYTIYNNALKYIDRRCRSKKEIYLYLMKKYNDEENVNNVISKLIENNLLNDKLFCKSYIMDKLYLSKDGIDKIKKDLYNHEVDSKIIEDAIDEIDLEVLDEKLYKLIEKYIKVNNKVNKNMLRMKVINHFMNLGYQKENILEVYDNFNIETDDNILKKEYIKLYKKYSKKYVDEKLDNYIKSRLFQKGFNLEEINKIKVDM